MSEPLRFPERYFERFPEAERLPNETMMNLIYLARLVTDGYDRIARAEGLSVSGVEVLRTLAVADGPLTPADLASNVLISTATMATVLATLERRGLIERSPHPTDGRKVLISLSAAADDVLARVMHAYLPFGHEIMHALSERELTTMYKAVVRLLAAVGPTMEAPSPRPREIVA